MSESVLQKDSHHGVPYTPSVTPHPVPRIGLLGLGSMGYPMARNLARHLASKFPTAPPLMVYNRTVKKADALAAEISPVRIAIASSAQQLALECDVIITSLANDAAVKSVYVEFAQALTVCNISLALDTAHVSFGEAGIAVAVVQNLCRDQHGPLSPFRPFHHSPRFTKYIDLPSAGRYKL